MDNLHWHVQRDPAQRISIEHVSSRAMVEAVRSYAGHVGVSVTPQHILHTGDDADVDPHLCCMPYPKTADDRTAIQELVLEGLPFVWYGDDNAPHFKETKLVAPPKDPASGVCNCVAGPPLMVDWFERQGALDKLGPFWAYHGCDWYGVPRSEGSIIFEEHPWIVPAEVGGVIPWMAGREIRYQLKSVVPDK